MNYAPKCACCHPEMAHVEARDDGQAARLIRDAQRISVFSAVWRGRLRAFEITREAAVAALADKPPSDQPPNVSALFSGAHISVFVGL